MNELESYAFILSGGTLWFPPTSPSFTTGEWNPLSTPHDHAEIVHAGLRTFGERHGHNL